MKIKNGLFRARKQEEFHFQNGSVRSSMESFSSKATITSKIYFWKQSHKVSGNHSKSKQQIKKHLFKKLLNLGKNSRSLWHLNHKPFSPSSRLPTPQREEAPLWAVVAKKGVPLPLSPSQGKWYLTERTWPPAFVILFSSNLQRVSSWLTQPRGYFLSSPNPQLIKDRSYLRPGGLRILEHQLPLSQVACRLEVLCWEKHTEKAKSYCPCPAPHKRAGASPSSQLRSRGSEILPRSKADPKRELWNSFQRNWLYLKKSVGKCKPKGSSQKLWRFWRQTIKKQLVAVWEQIKP